MRKSAHIPHVGAPDPERNTSPIFDENDDDTLSLDRDIETGACYFNDARYEIGERVLSGNEILQCEARGVWIRNSGLEPPT